ncbi:hypothetical protein HPB50_013297 [Hyalomma asiaticum]|uniref:Uncharacterized protein n=1 Tax=Hyalomma asiaticum TaxID=266040 RepID=A0ACB7RPB8_HYAAI|nr:hypothetical protein HPB50_013297 [Hyalomma asiaticum]
MANDGHLESGDLDHMASGRCTWARRPKGTWSNTHQARGCGATMGHGDGNIARRDLVHHKSNIAGWLSGVHHCPRLGGMYLGWTKRGGVAEVRRVEPVQKLEVTAAR